MDSARRLLPVRRHGFEEILVVFGVTDLFFTIAHLSCRGSRCPLGSLTPAATKSNSASKVIVVGAKVEDNSLSTKGNGTPFRSLKIPPGHFSPFKVIFEQWV